MKGLKAQNLVAKDGQRWTYPDVENDRPPWYEVYKAINESGPLTVNEIQERLASNFAFDCPSGDENSMLQWYLDHLQRQKYIEPDTVNRSGKTVDVYTVVSVSDQYNEELGRAKDRLTAAEELYERADELDVSNANSYENTISDLQARLNEYDEIFNPEHTDLNSIRGLIKEIVELEEDIESSVEDAEEQIIGDAKTLSEAKIDDLQKDINESDVSGSFSTRLDDLDNDLREYREELNELVDNEQYIRLKKRTGEIRQNVEEIEDTVKKITGLKTQCTEKYSAIKDEQSIAEDEVEKIAKQNSKQSDLQSKLSTLESHLAKYQDEYNNGNFEDALDTLDNDAKPLAEQIKRDAGEIVTDQTSYLDQLDDFEKQAEATDDKDRRVEAIGLIEEAREETKSGNFAEVPILIDDIEDLLEGPSPREAFLAELREVDGNLDELIENGGLSATDAFNFLKKTYGNEVTGIQVEFQSGDQ
jgi:chromosome segregation ATPase